MGAKAKIIRAGLEAAWLTRAHRLARPRLGGIGVILTLHGVTDAAAGPFHPNGILEVTPGFLDAAIGRVRASGFEIVPLDEAARRLAAGEGPRFAVLTFDDAYRNNLTEAWPVLERRAAPFTIYVPADYPDGRGVLWWLALEEIVAARAEVAFAGQRFPTADLAGKRAAWEAIYPALRAMGEAEQRAAMASLADEAGFDLHAQCRREIMTWDELGRLAREPLCTIGAHTLSHPMLAKLSEAEAREEMALSAETIADKLGVRPRHVSYPYGSPAEAGAREFRLAAELGFVTGVTTRPGMLFPEHAGHMTALPRVSLNGDYQSLRYLDVLLSGLPFFVWNGFKRLDVA
jgi:peptidoglycan/xylan/chitin deacetylase (PgdA/CDA1 family)